MKRSDWLARATAKALDSARAKARAEGREPSAEEFTEAINNVEEPPKRQRRAKRQPQDRRWRDFTMWIWTLSYHSYLEDIEQAPGGFDQVLFAEKLQGDEYRLEMCHKALSALQKAIPLLEVGPNRDRETRCWKSNLEAPAPTPNHYETRTGKGIIHDDRRHGPSGDSSELFSAGARGPPNNTETCPGRSWIC